jgi:Rieske Fe-S protein
MSEPLEPTGGATPETDRRTFLSKASSLAMAGGLATGYGTLAILAGKFLYPSHPPKKVWVFVTEADKLALNATVNFQTPAGQQVVITRRKMDGSADDFLALSTVCPHLGCQVHWEAQHQRFFCPCHNGAFDPAGLPIAGPPKDAGQTLPTFPLRLDNGLLFVQVSVEKLG